tara:strand:- start:211 stop:639 length:429 start_codon:yes stop_codon:yes gene_type:complete
MAAINLSTIRSTIETRLRDEFRTGRPITTVFSNTPFDASTVDTFIQCIVSFGSSSYQTQGSNTDATIIQTGLVLINIFTKQGVGSGDNFTICKRIRDLYNRMTVSDVIFDAPIGPEIIDSSPEGKFQTQMRITFEIYETLTT